MTDPLFSSVLCGAHNGPTGVAARRQAELLASPGGAVETVPAQALIRLDPETLADRCADHDLLVVANGPDAHRLLERAPIPALLARWCRGGPAELTERILLAVDDREGSEDAADLAGRLAARFGRTISLLAAPRHNARLERALNASERIVLCRTGAAPQVLGRRLPLEPAIAAECAGLGASLLVLGVGDHGIPRSTAADLAVRVGCCVLAVPVLVPAPGAAAKVERQRELVPA
jgi:nucleotide-binding universal stress UspA family protein